MATVLPSVEHLLGQAFAKFKTEFKKNPECCGCAPGRVNLIGEHTDYNEGFVFPMALPMVTLVLGARNGTDECRVVTLCAFADPPLTCSFPVPTPENPLVPGTPKWANYVKGVANFFPGTVPGFDAVVVGSVPSGGGLSSSASLEVAVYTFLEKLTGTITTTLTDKALVCQKAEHEFPKMPCGIMDQFISVLGKENNALLIDCRSFECSLVPLGDPSMVIVIINSNTRHELTGSEYPTRRAQCFRAAELMGKTSLREATFEDLENLKCDPLEKVIKQRARHVIGEIKRTVEGAAALQSGDFIKFGQLMTESHNSLRMDYEVSCAELDELVTLAMEVEGVLGSRMTGGGFGGSTVTLVKKDAVDNLIANVSSKYSGNATFYIATPAEGARVIPVDCQSYCPKQ